MSETLSPLNEQNTKSNGQKINSPKIFPKIPLNTRKELMDDSKYPNSVPKKEVFNIKTI